MVRATVYCILILLFAILFEAIYFGGWNSLRFGVKVHFFGGGFSVGLCQASVGTVNPGPLLMTLLALVVGATQVV